MEKVNKETTLNETLKEYKKSFRETNLHNIELLGTLGYLVSETNKDHTTKLSDIIHYLKTNFDIDSRNERIKYDLDFLYEKRNIIKKSLGLTINRVSVGNYDSYRYYIDNKGLNDKEILTIVECIRNYRFNETYSSVEQVEKMFLNAVSNKRKQVELTNDLSTIDKSLYKGNKKHLLLLKELKAASNNKTHVYLELKSLTTGLRDIPSVNESKKVDGVIYEVYEEGDELNIIFIDGIRHNPHMIPFKRVKAIGFDDKQTFDLNDVIKEKGYNSIEEYIYKNKEVRMYKTILTFQFTSNSLEKIKTSFETYFHKKFTYKVVREASKTMSALFKTTVNEDIFSLVDWIMESNIVYSMRNISSKFVLLTLERKLKNRLSHVQCELDKLNTKDSGNHKMHKSLYI